MDRQGEVLHFGVELGKVNLVTMLNYRKLEITSSNICHPEINQELMFLVLLGPALHSRVCTEQKVNIDY